MDPRKTREPVGNHPTPVHPTEAATVATQALNEESAQSSPPPPDPLDEEGPAIIALFGAIATDQRMGNEDKLRTLCLLRNYALIRVRALCPRFHEPVILMLEKDLHLPNIYATPSKKLVCDEGNQTDETPLPPPPPVRTYHEAATSMPPIPPLTAVNSVSAQADVITGLTYAEAARNTPSSSRYPPRRPQIVSAAAPTPSAPATTPASSASTTFASSIDSDPPYVLFEDLSKYEKEEWPIEACIQGKREETSLPPTTITTNTTHTTPRPPIPPVHRSSPRGAHKIQTGGSSPMARRGQQAPLHLRIPLVAIRKPASREVTLLRCPVFT